MDRAVCCAYWLPFSCAHEHAGAESGSDESDGSYYRPPFLKACKTPEEERAEVMEHLFYNVRYYLLELNLLPDSLLPQRDEMAGYITGEHPFPPPHV